MTTSESADHPHNRFSWSDADRAVPRSGSGVLIGQLPVSGPIARFNEHAEVLSHPPPGDATRPWVLASPDRVIKIYDLRAFLHSPDERELLLEEGRTALRVNGISGVVRTYHSGVVDQHWFVIEMDRLGPSLSSLLDDPSALSEPIDVTTLVRYFVEVAETLSQIHKRGVLHGDLRPGNLLLSPECDRLMVADFSASARLRRRFARRERNLHGIGDDGDPFRAPEQSLGQVGPKADQFGLAATAQAVLARGFPLNPPHPSVTDVLGRASAHDPAARYPSLDDFAAALRHAVEPTSRPSLSARLRLVDPRWRHAWGPAAAAYVAALAMLTVSRNARHSVAGSVVLPFIALLLTAIVFRAVNRWRARRSRPRWAPADRGWFPFVVFGLLVLVLSPILSALPSSRVKYIGYAAAVALLATAALGSVPTHAGHWLIRLTQRWERSAASVSGRAVRALVTVALAVGLVLVPALVSIAWPSSPDPADVRASRAATAVATVRQALLDGDVTRVCHLIAAPRQPQISTCRQWAAVAIRWHQQDVSAGRGVPFTPRTLSNLRVIRQDDRTHSVIAGWELRTDAITDRDIGYADQNTQSGDVWTVTVSRISSGDVLAGLASSWSYEVVDSHGRWSVTSLRVCDYRATNPCVTLTQLTPSQLRRASLDGVPVAR